MLQYNNFIPELTQVLDDFLQQHKAGLVVLVHL